MARLRALGALAAATCLLLAAGAGCRREAVLPERVVLVTVDTLRADHVGAYGAAQARTPTFDAVAAEGVRFETAISPVPLTLPTHTSIMTGLTPPAHGVRHNSVFKLAGDVPTLAERMREGGFATAAFVAAFVLDRQFGLGRGFDSYDDRMSGQRPGAPSAYAERPADAVVDATLAWLANAPDRFFLWVHLYDPHSEYAPPLGFAAAFPRSPYDGEIAFADAQLGRLVAEIDRRWDPARTLLVFTSDHGESLGEHGEPTHGYLLYDATQRVPLVMRGPGLPRGEVVKGVVSLIDLAPTLLGLAGLAPLGGAEGTDLRARIRAPGRSPEKAYMETLATRFDFGWSPLFGLRDHDYAWIRAPRPELYAMAKDPGQTKNLAAQEDATAARLDRELAARLAGAPPVRANVTLGAEERARLESLGYVVPETTPAADSVDYTRVGGPDPKDELRVLREISRATRLMAVGRHADALALLAPFGEDGFTLPLIRSQAALAVGNLAEAERSARASLVAAPAHHAPHVALGQALELQGRFQEAGKAFENAVRCNPDEPEALLGLGRTAEVAGDRERARELYHRAGTTGVADSVPEAVWREAALRLESGETQEAEAMLATLPAAALHEPGAALRLAIAEREAGRSEAGLARLRAAVGAGDASPTLYRYYAAWLDEEGRDAEALAVREAALARSPDSAAAQNDLAWALASQGRDLGRALALAQAAARAAPGEPAVLDTLATVQLRRGDAEAALETARSGLETATGGVRAQLLELETEALRVLGRGSEARSPD